MALQTEPILHTPFNRRMAEGHKMRIGHKLNRVQVTADGVLWHGVNLCCGETAPETVTTWADTLPVMGGN